jgi:hypothetical protein
MRCPSSAFAASQRTVLRSGYGKLQPSPRKMVESAAVDHDDAGRIQADRKFSTPEPRARLIASVGCPLHAPRGWRRRALPGKPVSSEKTMLHICNEDRTALELVIKTDFAIKTDCFIKTDFIIKTRLFDAWLPSIAPVGRGLSCVPERAQSVACWMNPATDPCDRPTSKRGMPHRSLHDVKHASERHDPAAFRTIRVGSAPIKRRHRCRRRLLLKEHAANLMQRATGEPTAKRRIACLVAERDPRNRHPACKPSLVLGMATRATAPRANALRTNTPRTNTIVPTPAILRPIDTHDLAIVCVRACLPGFSGIPSCQESLHITRALLRALLLSPPDSRCGLLLPPFCRLVMPCFSFRFALRLSVHDFFARNFFARNFFARDFLARNFLARNFLAYNFLPRELCAQTRPRQRLRHGKHTARASHSPTVCETSPGIVISVRGTAVDEPRFADQHRWRHHWRHHWRRRVHACADALHALDHHLVLQFIGSALRFCHHPTTFTQQPSRNNLHATTFTTRLARRGCLMTR